jgi:hypothetical protein
MSEENGFSKDDLLVLRNSYAAKIDVVLDELEETFYLSHAPENQRVSMYVTLAFNILAQIMAEFDKDKEYQTQILVDLMRHSSKFFDLGLYFNHINSPESSTNLH